MYKLFKVLILWQLSYKFLKLNSYVYKASLWSFFPYVSFSDNGIRVLQTNALFHYIHANIVSVHKYWSQLSNKLSYLSYLFLKTSLHLGTANKKEKICIVDAFKTYLTSPHTSYVFTQNITIMSRSMAIYLNFIWMLLVYQTCQFYRHFLYKMKYSLVSRRVEYCTDSVNVCKYLLEVLWTV